MSVNSRRECPDCEGHHTERVCIEFEEDDNVEVRHCNECELEYENRFTLIYQEVVYYE